MITRPATRKRATMPTHAIPHVETLHRDGPRTRLLLLVHGFGYDPATVLEHVPRIDPHANWLAVAPTAPFTRKGRPIWHEPLSHAREDSVGQFLTSLDLLDDLLEDLCAEHDLRRDEAVVGGFSQGAGLTFGLVIRRSQRPRPAGCLSWSGFVPLFPGLDADWEPARATAVHMQYGVEDDMMPVQVSRMSAATLAEHDVPLSLHEFDGGHEVNAGSLHLVRQWLTEVHVGLRPSEPGVPPNSPGAQALGDLWSELAS